MAENPDEIEKRTVEKESTEDEISTSEAHRNKANIAVLRTQDDFRRVGKNYTENIKASLLASSADFRRGVRYATTLEDPYMRAYRYLEENKVLALLEVCCKMFVQNIKMDFLTHFNRFT